MPETAAFCPACGREVGPNVPPRTTADKFKGAASYLTFIPAAVFLLSRRFRKNRFVRFHSFQSLFFAFSLVGAGALMWLLFSGLMFIPHFGFLFAWLVVGIGVLGCAMVWLVLLIKALQGEFFQLPVIGGFAAQRTEN